MDKEQHHHQATAHNSHRFVDSFAPMDGGAAPEEQQQPSGGEMVDYMLGQPQAHHHAAAASQQQPITQNQMSSLDKLSFSDVLHFADFGPKLALNNNRSAVSAERDDDDDEDDDDSYFFRFQSLPPRGQQQQNHHVVEPEEGSKTTADGGGTTNVSESTTLVQQQQQQAADKAGNKSGGGRRKRPRTVKTSEEVESQRMTHIAVERNRRRQMNEYLRVLRSLMPGSYVQRGDQASIIGGAIEFIRELEQLIQCLESQKRRRLYGDAPRPPLVADATAGAGAPPSIQQPQPPPFFSPSLPFPTASGGSGGSDGGAAKILDLDVVGAAGGLGNREEVAENKSCLADIEVRALGPDAMIKILSRRRPGQLIKTIAALEEMQMNILHTNVTTIEQTVLYSFNVKIAGDARLSAEDIAGAVHQILSFIDINYTI